MQHFCLEPAGTDNSQQAAQLRRMERAISFGLWLLVMLTAITMGVRMLDIGAPTAPPIKPAVRPLAPGDAANAIRSATPVAGRSRDADQFDDPIPAFLPEQSPVTAPASAPTEAPSKTATRLTPAVTLAAESPPAANASSLRRQESGSLVCADALRAMQLCPEKR